MNIFDSINISTSGLTAEKTRIDIISENMANVNTTRTTGAVPYRRKVPVFKTEEGTGKNSFSDIFKKKTSGISKGGVKVSKIIEDDTPFKLKYEPGHPDSNEEGYVEMPNVDTVKEMVDLISAQRSYDANITAINTSKAMLNKALDIGRR